MSKIAVAALMLTPLALAQDPAQYVAFLCPKSPSAVLSNRACPALWFSGAFPFPHTSGYLTLFALSLQRLDGVRGRQGALRCVWRRHTCCRSTTPGPPVSVAQFLPLVAPTLSLSTPVTHSHCRHPAHHPYGDDVDRRRKPDAVWRLLLPVVWHGNERDCPGGVPL